MGKLEFESKKEMKEFYYEVVFKENSSNIDLLNFLNRCTHHGYLKKSDLEKAKDEYIEYKNKNITGDLIFDFLPFHDYSGNLIHELEKEIERLKNKWIAKK